MMNSSQPDCYNEDYLCITTDYSTTQSVVGIIIPLILVVSGVFGNILAMIVLLKLRSPSKTIFKETTVRTTYSRIDISKAIYERHSEDLCFDNNNNQFISSKSSNSRGRFTRKGDSLFLIFICLAPIDNIFLLLYCGVNIIPQLYMVWPTKFNWVFQEIQAFLIYYLWPLIMSVMMISIYMTVLISYERWVAVVHPFIANTRHIGVGNRRKFGVAIMFICLFSVIYNLPRFWEVTIIKETSTRCILKNNSFRDIHMCRSNYIKLVKSEFSKTTVYSYGYSFSLYVITNFILPLSFIAFFNIQIVIKLKFAYKHWQNASKRHQNQMRLTRVPLAIVFFFCVLSLPSVIINSLDAVGYDTENYQTMIALANLGVLINSAGNIIIYCFMGRKFRTTLVNLLPKFLSPMRRKKSQSGSSNQGSIKNSLYYVSTKW